MAVWWDALAAEGRCCPLASSTGRSSTVPLEMVFSVHELPVDSSTTAAFARLPLAIASCPAVSRVRNLSTAHISRIDDINWTYTACCRTCEAASAGSSLAATSPT
jgi:hypothetical protein